MTGPDGNVLRALIRLQGNEDFDVIKAWVEESAIEEGRELSGITDDVRMRMKQGRVQQLQELSLAFSDAKRMLTSMESRASKSRT